MAFDGQSHSESCVRDGLDAPGLAGVWRDFYAGPVRASLPFSGDCTASHRFCDFSVRCFAERHFVDFYCVGVQDIDFALWRS